MTSELGAQPKAKAPLGNRVVVVVLVLIALGVAFGGFFSYRGAASSSQVAQQTKHSDCKTAVASMYDAARDDILLGIGNQDQFTAAQQELRHLYYPNGTDHPKVSRADLTEQLCP